MLKPAEFTPMTAALLVEAIDRVGFPRGVVNLVTGRGSVIGDALVTHPAVRAISFTGSTEVGLGIAAKVAERPVKTQLELGGKNPLVVLADADLESALNAAVVGAYACSGQWCTSTSRVIVEEPLYDAFVEGLLAKVKEITVGDGLDERTRMGPVAGPKQFATIAEYLAVGRQEGASVSAGGSALTEGQYARGYYRANCVHQRHTHHAHRARRDFWPSTLRLARQRLRGCVVPGECHGLWVGILDLYA